MINTVNPIMTAIRSIFVVTDLSIYWLLGFIYELFFNIATFNIVDREMVFNIFSRVQLVVGVYMMFQLILIIIKGIVNPDSFTDSKTGAGNLIMRIIVSLSLLALLVPINIPSPKNEYEKQINNSGLLFGTLYSLQYRILANNTLGNLILGRDSEYGNPTSTKPTSRPLAKFSDRFVGAIVKTFYQLNVDETTGEYVCDDGFDEEYNKVDTSPFLIIAKGMVGCNNSSWPGKPYVLTMTFLISSIAGIVLCVLMFMMCFEVAKRVFQLAALQLLAPIPIISYMDPKGSKDGAFNSWLKLLGTTYLDLFTRLAVIYFTIFIIDGFIDKFLSKTVDLAVTSYSGDFLAGHLLTKWTFIVMCIALFIFAKDAPKFFKQMLGIKGDGKFFSAFGDAMGLAGSAAGAIGSFNASRQASANADFTNTKGRAKEALLKRNPKLTDAQADAAATRYANKYAHTGLNRAKNTAAGLFGAGAGLLTGSAAASENKGNAWAKMMAASKAMSDRNRDVMDAGRNGGTFLGGLGSLGHEAISGQSVYDDLEADWKKREQAIKDDELVLKKNKDMTANINKAMNRAKSKGLDSDKTIGSYKIRDSAGQTVEITGNYRSYHSAYEAAVNHGTGVQTVYVASDGVTKISKQQYDQLGADVQVNYTEQSYFTFEGQKIDMAQANSIDMGLKDANIANYYDQATAFDSEVQRRVRDQHMSEADAIAAVKADIANGATNFGFEDTTIAAARAAYRTSNSGKDMARVYENHDITDANGNVTGVETGLKVEFGNRTNADDDESDRLNREREKINSERQGWRGQQALYNAKRFKKK